MNMEWDKVNPNESKIMALTTELQELKKKQAVFAAFGSTPSTQNGSNSTSNSNSAVNRVATW